MRNNGDLLLLRSGMGGNFLRSSALPYLHKVGIFTLYSERVPNIQETNALVRERSQGQIESAIQSILLSKYKSQVDLELPTFQQSENKFYQIKKAGKPISTLEAKIKRNEIIVAINENVASEQHVTKGCTHYFKIDCKLKFSPLHIGM